MSQPPESQQQYGSILTILGENAEQNGKLKNKQITFTHIAIGDANDTYVQPDRKQTALVNELARIPVNSVDVLQPTPDSTPMLKVEAILPDDVNDLIIREFAAVATFDGNTYFHAVGNCARIYVPAPVNNGNVSTPVTLEMIFVITSAEPIVEIDPNVVTASREWSRNQLRLLELQQYGVIWPENIDKVLPLGLQNTVVSLQGVTGLRIESVSNQHGVLIFPWPPSGNFGATTHTIKNIEPNEIAGYYVTTEHGQFEFVTRDVLDLRGHDLASLKNIIASDKAVYRTSVADFNEHLSGGGGDFVYDKSDAETEENGITVITPKNGGRLKKPNLSPIALSEGKCRSGIDNRSHLQKLFAVSVSEKRALIIDGDYEFSGVLDTENVSLIGHGRRKSILRPMGIGSHLWLGSFLDASDFAIIGDMKSNGLVSKKNAGQWILDNLLITNCDNSVELSETYIGTLRDCELRANNKNIATTSRNGAEARVNNIRLFGGSLTQAKVAAIDVAAGQFTKNLQLYGTNVEDNAAGIRAYQNLVGVLLSGAWFEENGTQIYAEKAFSGFRMLGGTMAFNNPDERGLVLGGNVQAGNTFEGVEFQIPDPQVQLYSVLHGRRLTMKECIFKRDDFNRNDPNGLVRIINSAVGEGAQKYGYHTTGQVESGAVTLLPGETKAVSFSTAFYTPPKVTTGTLGGGERSEPVMTAPTINGFTITNRGDVTSTVHWQASED
ncbi:phage tail-collar fiber domain-containing protein [Photobacterium sp. GSS17]|uniref:phage tail-collar fiber domain-containing protein n=1 Tax=Photobacterium sp. GSS17 TaxID=3020715 RepID=UPI00236091FD|nr:phage tail protein [Photobacterium sp. GSS17]